MSLEDIIVGMRRQLLASPQFSVLIGTDVGQDAPGGAWSDGWVFRGTDSTDSPNRNPRNTGTSSVVLSMRAPWTSPNRHNTLTFPELNVSILSDMTRGNDPTLIQRVDAEFRCDRVASAISATFNDVGNVLHVLPNGAFIVSCVLWTDLRMSYVPGEDGLVQGNMSFALEVG